VESAAAAVPANPSANAATPNHFARHALGAKATSAAMPSGADEFDGGISSITIHGV
jgi:hypothetical protein